MKWNKLLLGIGIGIIGGTFLSREKQSQPISAEKAIKKVKKAFQEQGPIEGSWIYMTPEKFTKNNLTYHVYRGGITKNIEETMKQFEFIVDAETGTILEVSNLD